MAFTAQARVPTYQASARFPIEEYAQIRGMSPGAQMLNQFTEQVPSYFGAVEALQKRQQLAKALSNLSSQYPEESAVRRIGPVMEASPELSQFIIPKLLDSQLEKEKRTYQRGSILDDEGRPIVTRFSTATGEEELKDPVTGEWKPIPGGSVRGFAPQFRVDPISGQLLRADASGETYSVGAPGFGLRKEERNLPENSILRLRQISPKLHERFVNILDGAYPDKNQFMKQSIEGANAAANAKAVLKDPNPSQVGLQSLGFYFARMAGSNSQLSDAERTIFEQPLSLMDRVVNKGYRVSVGDLSPKMRRDLIRLADVISTKTKIQGRQIIDAQRKRAKAELGRFYTPGLDQSFPTFESLSVSPESVIEQLGGGGTNSVPSVGGTFNGSKVLSVERVD